MGINIGSTGANGVWIGGGNNDIVREGLVFWIDSGQHKSFTGSGTTVYDMSGQNNNGTLTNSPTFAGHAGTDNTGGGGGGTGNNSPAPNGGKGGTGGSGFVAIRYKFQN